jgi:hypothetical protein
LLGHFLQNVWMQPVWFTVILYQNLPLGCVLFGGPLNTFPLRVLNSAWTFPLECEVPAVNSCQHLHLPMKGPAVNCCQYFT